MLAHAQNLLKCKSKQTRASSGFGGLAIHGVVEELLKQKNEPISWKHWANTQKKTVGKWPAQAVRQELDRLYCYLYPATF